MDGPPHSGISALMKRGRDRRSLSFSRCSHHGRPCEDIGRERASPDPSLSALLEQRRLGGLNNRD